MTMIINRQRKGANFPSLSMNDETLEEIQSYKHFTETLNWDEHIENLTVKVSHCLDVLNVLKFKLDFNTLENYILPSDNLR